MVVYFIITTKYVEIKQEGLLRLYDQIRQALDRAKTRQHFTKIWKRYHKLTHSVGDLCHEIEGLDHFWNRFVTCFYTLDICFITYSVYIIFLVPVALQQKFIFLLLFVYALISLFVMLKQCAYVVNNNERIDRHNRAFLEHFQREKSLQVRNVLKVCFISSIEADILLVNCFLN